MATHEELRAVRIQKLANLNEAGMNPFTAQTFRTHTIAEALINFDKLATDGLPVTIAGRIMAKRGQGALVFMNLKDGTGIMQALLKKDNIDEAKFNLFTDNIDIADFVEVTGTLFVTNTGQNTILITDWRVLTKAIEQLPDTYHGMTDADERYRKRYLDLLLNDEAREMFALKSKFWAYTREFLTKRDFIEVETPTLEVTTGGAEARPFKTFHNDYDMDVFLRISVGELWQKRLMAAGFARTFEIGRVYRNEGSSPEHLQEFTNLEFYAAYMDYNEGMQLTEDLIKGLAANVFGKMEFNIKGHTVNLHGPNNDGIWPRLDYVHTVMEMTGIDVMNASADEMKAKLKELNVEWAGDNRERLMDTLWKFCRKQISGPAWLIHHPKIVSPLSKACPDNSELTERCQLIMACAEVTNGFSELNDPIDQRARFELQQQLIERGDDEAMMPEWEFVEMLEHGMPPTFGFGMGERLFAFLMDKPIRETQLFPLVKPRLEEK